MSDEEDYSEEEWEPYYDDGFGAQADDLAEHSLPSPPYLDYNSDAHDNLSEGEIMEGDVLEYLDFYYDDDPSLMNNCNGLETIPPLREKRKATDAPPKSKKRKVEAGRDTHDRFGDEEAKHTGRGIVWKVEDRSDLPTYEPGKGEKVALLKDWRNLFDKPLKENDKRSVKPTLVARARDSKKRKAQDSAESDDSPGLDNPTKAPQFAKGPRLRTTLSTPKSSPLKNALSSEDIPSMNANGPRKRPKPPSPDQSIEDLVTAAAPATKKRRNPEDDESGPVNSKRRAVGGKVKEDAQSKPMPSTRQSRGRKAAGT